MKAITHAGIATLGWAWTSRTKGILCRKNLCLKSLHNRILSRRSHGSHVNSLAGVAHKGIL